MVSTCAGRRPDSTVHGPCQCPPPPRCRRRHHGRRRRHPALPAHQGPRQAGGPPRRQVPPRRHSHQQLHQLRAAPHLRPDPVQQQLAPPPHPGRVPVRRLRSRASSRSSPRSRPRTGSTGTRAPPTPCGRTCVHLANYPHKLVLILSGDQLYRMDFRAVLEQHIATGADATVATIPVSRRDAGAFGIMQVAPDRRITRFVEKPQEAALLDELRVDWACHRPSAGERGARLAPRLHGHLRLQARGARCRALAGPEADFGKHVIPALIETRTAPLPTSIRATGRTSAPSAPSTRPTSTSASRCPSSTSTTPRRRSSPTRATSRPARSSGAGSIAPSSPTAASSTTPSSSIRSSGSGAGSRPAPSSAIR